MNSITSILSNENEEFSAMDTSVFRMRSSYSRDTDSTEESTASGSDMFAGSKSEPSSTVTDDVNIHQLGPGAQLAHMRKQQKMTVNQVAERLRLNPSVIHYLEDDDYKKLPAPIFVIGYMRNYARLLEKDPEPILKIFKDTIQGEPQSPPLQATPRVKKTQNEKAEDSNDPWFKVVTFLLAMVMLFLVALWSMYPAKVDNLSTDASGDAPAEIALAESVEGNGSPMSVAPDGTVTFTGTTPLSEESPLPVVPDAVSPSATETAESEDSPVADPRKLKINFTQDVWLRVVDADGKELFNSTGTPDRPVDVEGEPPFIVRLGRFSGMTVEYMSKQITDLQNYPDRNGRNFTFGEPLSP